jgi:hypothetical protein
VELPRVTTPIQNKIREVGATREVSGKVDEQDEARELKSRRKKIDEQKNGAEPVELGGKVNEGATAIDASDTRVPVEKPIQSRV